MFRRKKNEMRDYCPERPRPVIEFRLPNAWTKEVFLSKTYEPTGLAPLRFTTVPAPNMPPFGKSLTHAGT